MRIRALLAAGVLLSSFVISCPAPAVATTFDLQLVVYCPDQATPCGESSERRLAKLLFNRVEEVNLEWRPTGISFRPLPIQFNYGAGQRALNLTDSSGDSALAGVSNETLVEELRGQAALTPDVVTLFLIPGLAKCWSAIPPSSSLDGDPHTGFFCTPTAGGTSFAHELGHHFCLRHTFTNQDIATHGPAPNHDGDAGSLDNDWYGHYEFGVNDTPADPGKVEEFACTAVCEDDMSLSCAEKNVVCALVGLGDCICKPGFDLDNSGDPVDDQEWCIPTKLLDVDADSPHDGYCTTRCVRGSGGGMVDEGYNPDAANAMSYYSSSGCRGPFVRNGVRHEAFSRDQVAAIQACATDPLLPWRSDLPDVCAARGGDSDYDGICDDDDSCPRDRDIWVNDYDGDDVPDIADVDRDGVGDVCDTCPNDPNADQSDTDGDGVGDVCDDDIDNDGCLNAADQHPGQAQAVVGHWVNGACTPSQGSLYRFEGGDSDGDGIVDCADDDDDNDGVLDGDDPCPVHPHESLACQEVRQCAETQWSSLFEPFDESQLRDLRVRFVDEFYPALFDELEFRGVGVRRLNPSEIDARELFINPIRDWGVWENINVIAEGPQARSRGAARWRVELWYKDVAKMADLALLNAASILVDTSVRGSLIKLRLGSGTEQPSMGGAWVAGAGDTDLPGGDADGDLVPGVVDNCPSVANPLQRDRDFDHLGDLCDADFDGDGKVSAEEYKRVRRCKGWGSAKFTLPEDCGATDEPVAAGPTPEVTKKDARKARAAQKKQLRLEKRVLKKSDCEAADLDSNGVVDKADIAIAKGLYAAGK